MSDKERKNKGFSFRVPKKLRDAINWAARYTAKKNNVERVSQSDFMVASTEAFLREMEELPMKELLLPDGFSIPTDDSRMVSIRISMRAKKLVFDQAPRMYHSATRLILWASVKKAYDCFEEYSLRKQQAAEPQQDPTA